jgi:hypothetical protein
MNNQPPTDIADHHPDVLDGDWNPRAWWSRANAGEAMPGVLTPLTWSFWGPAAERATRQAFIAIGALDSASATLPHDPHERMLAVFHRRVAVNVHFIGAMGDRLPGTTGATVAEQVLGTLPTDFYSAPTHKRLPIVAARLPVAAILTPRRLRAAQHETAEWWSKELARGPLDLAASTGSCRAASPRSTRSSHSTDTTDPPRENSPAASGARTRHPSAR